MIEPIVASIIIAFLSLSGALFFGARGGITGAHRFILPFAVGVFLGIVFFELVPETIEASQEFGPIAIMVGFLGFYLLSHFLSTFHHHHHAHASHDTCVGAGAYKLLIGDAVHNAADGVVIATAFFVSPAIGIATTIGVGLHEVVQEIAEYGVLVASGCSRKKAALYNLLSASTVIVGAALTLLFAKSLGSWLFALTGIAAGNLLYIATADLIPELRDSHRKHFWQVFLATVVGLIAIAALINVTHS